MTNHIISGGASCPGVDEIHGTVPDAETARDIMARPDAVGHGHGGDLGSFLVEPFPFAVDVS